MKRPILILLMCILLTSCSSGNLLNSTINVETTLIENTKINQSTLPEYTLNSIYIQMQEYFSGSDMLDWKNSKWNIDKENQIIYCTPTEKFMLDIIQSALEGNQNEIYGYKISLNEFLEFSELLSKYVPNSSIVIYNPFNPSEILTTLENGNINSCMITMTSTAGIDSTNTTATTTTTNSSNQGLSEDILSNIKNNGNFFWDKDAFKAVTNYTSKEVFVLPPKDFLDTGGYAWYLRIFKAAALSLSEQEPGFQLVVLDPYKYNDLNGTTYPDDRILIIKGTSVLSDNMVNTAAEKTRVMEIFLKYINEVDWAGTMEIDEVNHIIYWAFSLSGYDQSLQSRLLTLIPEYQSLSRRMASELPDYSLAIVSAINYEIMVIVKNGEVLYKVK